ncbi:hypothetical protein POM88_052723 [Heracleum sosnowskyi]|uniref:Ubiquitin-like domain-containing protein n=1 Tax=Heracleum sosnowskyi TaxID=360622 RepID=A0AAD8GRJ6_9APIA|nr:hypothetical protein POM88_052723 [Heracleum sosnowskyi]
MMVNSSSDQSHRDNPSGGTALSIYMRTGLNVLSLLVQASDLVQSIEKTIELRIGIPVFEQELYYRGQKLHSGSTLREYTNNDNEAELKLVDKRQVRDVIQNPYNEKAWELLYDFVFLLDTISSEEENNKDLTDFVKETLRDYLEKTPTQFEKAEKYIKIFISSAALAEFMIFCRSNIKYHKSCAKHLMAILLQWSKKLPPPLQCLSAPILLELDMAFSR